jgi:hypothetical protein
MNETCNECGTEYLWFMMKQIVDLKFLTDDQHHQVESNNDDITGIL